MDNLGLHLKIVGGMMIVLALVHIVFPRRFNWKQEFAPLSLLSRQIMYVHTFFVALVVLMNGLLCLLYSKDLLEHSSLSLALAWGMFVFWGLRCLFQFVVYSPKLWKGKKFETRVHILFSAVWIYFALVFFFLLISF
jgi:hypothetical protein